MDPRRVYLLNINYSLTSYKYLCHITLIGSVDNLAAEQKS